jgi:hypothetical protein
MAREALGLLDAEVTLPFYVYCHRRQSDGAIFYIGKGSGKRWKDQTGRSEYWHRVAKKHGWIPEILVWFNNEVCAFSFEVAFIAFLGRGKLVNATRGGEGVSMPSLHVRKKMSDAKKGMPLSWGSNLEKVKAARAKQSETVSIQIVTDRGECFKNGIEAVSFLRSNGYPTASRGNISACINRKQKTAYGRTWCKHGEVPEPYVRLADRVGKAKSKPVVRSDGVSFQSASEAARCIGGTQGNISMVCRGERTKAYGYGWAYK